MAIERVVLVDLESDVQNVGLLMCTPRFGMTVIAAVLARAGYEVTVLADAYHKVRLEAVLARRPDAVLFNGMKTTLHRVRRLARAVRERLPGVPIVCGGEEAALHPASFAGVADYVVLHEGDEVVLALLGALGRGEDPVGVRGILIRAPGEGEGWVRTAPAPRVRRIDYRVDPDLYPGLRPLARSWLARWTGLTPSGRLLFFPLQTSRGCDRACSFCTWLTLFGGGGYIERPLDDVLHDLDVIWTRLGVQRFMVVDNLFGARRAYALALAEELVRRYGGRRRRPELTALMRADPLGPEGFFYKRKIRAIRRDLRPHLRFLRTVEAGMVREGLYRRRGARWELDEDRLRAGVARRRAAEDGIVGAPRTAEGARRSAAAAGV